MLLLFQKGGGDIRTYQDYIGAAGEGNIDPRNKNRLEFIVEAWNEHVASKTYEDAVIGQAYFEQKNQAIVSRFEFLDRMNIKKQENIKNFSLRCGFFRKMCMQEASYLTANGVSLEDDAYKEMLGVDFDRQFQIATLQAEQDGVNWIFWNEGKTLVFRATEFCPVLDEENGDMRMGIRRRQMDDKPVYYDVFEEDGITVYIAEKDGTAPKLLRDKQPYMQTVQRDAISETVVDESNYPTIPVFPLYPNELKRSELTDGLKEHIDAHDFINSDLADSITQIEGVYWIIRNYGGDSEDAKMLIDEIQKIKATAVDGDGTNNSGADSHSIEVPFMAKQTALELLEHHMYDDTMTLDTKELSGGSLTNVAIKVAMTNFDIKVDQLELNCIDVVEKILALKGVTDANPQFKRRTIINDSEAINDLSTLYNDGAIDTEFYVKHCPVIPDEEQDKLLERLDAQAQEQANETYPLEQVEEDAV